MPEDRTGLFSRELLADLREAGDAWPPDVSALADRQRERFADLRAQGLARQTPTYLWFRDRTGREGQLLAAASTSESPAPENRGRRTDPAPLVDALEAIPGFSSLGFRDELVALLRRGITGGLQRSSRPRLEAVSLVTTCQRFSGGLAELLDAVRLCAGDVPEVQALRTAIDTASSG